MRSVSRIKKVLVMILAAAIAIVAMALPVCASPAPTESPTPYNDSPTPLYPTSVNTALSVYYIKFQHSSTFTNNTDIDTDGSIVSYSGRSVSQFISITPSVDRMICARSLYNGKFSLMRHLAFYDSSLNFITSSYYTEVYEISGLEIPTNAAYFRVSFVGSSSVLANNIRILISPEIVSGYFDSSTNSYVFVDYFWRDYLTFQSYMIYPNGKVVFTVTSSFAFDELYAEFTLTSRFYSASYISCRVYTEVKDGSYGNNYYPANYTVHGYQGDAYRPSIRSFFFSSDASKIYGGWEQGVSYDNPATLLAHDSSLSPQISGFTINIPLNKPDGLLADSSVSVTVDSIYLDDYAIVIKELSIDTANNIDLNLSQAAIPEPSFDISAYYDDAFADVDTTMALTVYGWFWAFPFIVSMTSIVAVIALISYILFGKKG